jgi:hypothetical protein
LADAATVRLDASTVQLHEPLHEREADPQSAMRTIQRAGGLHEEIEYVWQKLRCDAHAVVAHTHDDLRRLRNSSIIPIRASPFWILRFRR